MRRYLYFTLAILTLASSAQESKEIRDPAEYNRYVTILGICTSAPDQTSQLTASLREFIQLHPSSHMKEEALELLMATYIQRNDSSKAEEIAHELIQSHPDNLAGLVVAVQGSGSKLKSQETAEFAKRGMQVIASAPNNQHLREWNDLVSLASQVFKNQGTQDKSLSDVSVIIRHRYCTFRPVV